MKKIDHLLRSIGNAARRSLRFSLMFAAIGLMFPVANAGTIIAGHGAMDAGGVCAAFAGTLTGPVVSPCLVENGVTIEATPTGDANVPPGYLVMYLLSQEGVILEANSEPSFTVIGLGDFSIHTVVFDNITWDMGSITLGSTTVDEVFAMFIEGGGSICASIDVEGYTVFVADPDAGGLTADMDSVCLTAGGTIISATPDGDIEVPDGYSVIYLLSMGSALSIEAIGPDPMFSVTAAGDYGIHTLVYSSTSFDPAMDIALGTTTITDLLASLASGGGDICAALDAGGALIEVITCGDICLADAGEATPTASSVCLDDGSAMIGADVTGTMVPGGYVTAYVLTEGGIIMQLGDAPEFTVAAEGSYTIHTLVYDPLTLDLSIVDLGTTPASAVIDLIEPEGDICAALDVEGATVMVTECAVDCLADAGDATATASSVCLDDGSALIGADVTGTMVPEGYVTAYVLTEGGIIMQLGDAPEFTVAAEGSYTIHTLVYDPLTLDLSIVDLGTTPASAVIALIEPEGDICAALDVEGATVMVMECAVDCLADAGEATATASSVCLEDGSALIGADVTGTMVPEGYVTAYVLTEGGIIMQLGDAPEFTVAAEGSYTIHTLVYDPLTLDLSIVDLGTTPASAVIALIEPEGDICAALDVEGATVMVTECGGDCTAYAGTLDGYKPVLCYQEGGSLIGAIAVGDAVIPPGYQIAWVATSGEDLVIEAVADMPYFIVDGMGLYTIHTLVYDPLTLDLSSIEFGVTTAAEVNALLIQGGGSICASLDVTGVEMMVDSPDAGTLSSTMEEVCLDGGSATVSATLSGSYLPMGYDHLYLLVGPDMTIMDSGDTPSFEVMMAGTYSIHTLVHDPLTFDFGMIVPGATTLAVLNDHLVQGGGLYCAALDLDGATIDVIDCSTDCTAYAGTLESFKPVLCYQEGGSLIGAIAVGDVVVPPGFEILYVVTHGEDLVIDQVGEWPILTVDGMGLYTIHTLVYDPLTLDLSSIEFGVTTAAEVNALLIQGGGSICASLDLTGAEMIVDSPDAGTLSTTMEDVCLEDGSATVSATLSGSYLPMGYDHLYLLVGPDMTIMDSGDTPSFEVMMAGTYSIHTLVHDPLTFDFGMIVPGATTLAVLNDQLVQGGGLYCAALDLAGISIDVIECGGSDCTADAGTLTPLQFETCLGDSAITISAVQEDPMVVPVGYEVIYLLATGPDMTISDSGTDPEFMVNVAGNYGFHTLVYHPATFDPVLIALGITTIADIHGMLIQGGGSICASLDIVGAHTLVIDCTVDCAADAGTLDPDTVDICLTDGAATLIAVPGSGILVPDGYQVMYLLSQGVTPVIHSGSPTPVFLVTSADTWRIHTLVYDPATWDISIIDLGVTTIMELNAMLVQGGGSICAALDTYGATFNVTDCSDCLAFHGTLSSTELEVCLTKGAFLEATQGTDIVIPPGYAALYVVVSDFMIIDLSATPSAYVTDLGEYSIHTLVYDPTTLDLGFIVPGVTTPQEILDAILLQITGPICASFDVEGIHFEVIDCSGDEFTIENVWPVPATEQVTVKLNAPTTSQTQLLVIDAQGREVMPATTIAKGVEQVTLDVHAIGSGNYTLRLIGNDNVSTYGFVKAR